MIAITKEEAIMIREHRTLQAIKAVRYRLNCNIREAKNIVDAWDGHSILDEKTAAEQVTIGIAKSNLLALLDMLERGEISMESYSRKVRYELTKVAP